MRTFCLSTAVVLLAMTHSALAESKWLESKRLYVCFFFPARLVARSLQQLANAGLSYIAMICRRTATRWLSPSPRSFSNCAG
jgi:hypothetical protein